MADTPWLGDTCSLVDAFRKGERSPVEELDATLAAIESSTLNAFSYLDVDAARTAAERADVSLPFGGVPVGMKELDSVQGWPATEASVPLKDRVADYDSTKVARLRATGSVLVGMTTASEFGGINITRTRLNGTTRNPWDHERTPGGSSGGSAAAVAGGLVSIATGGDGGGSIRIPAAFCGLPGLKATYGRIPKGPHAEIGSITAVSGCLSRSVRDIARWFDVTNGFDSRDPLSLPRVEGWEAGLGTHLEDLRGKKVAFCINLGNAIVAPDVVTRVEEAGRAMIADAGLELVEVKMDLPTMGVAWALAGLAGILKELGDKWPDCKDDLTPQIAFGLDFASQAYNLAGRAEIETRREELNEAMAAVFDQVDFVISATNPDIAFSAERWALDVAGTPVGPENNGALTIPANIYGNPSISIPVGNVRDCPVGMQVMGRHHAEPLLLDIALLVERTCPWPLVAPGAPI